MSLLNSRCHYERLGVASTADSETLRQAFRRRSKDLHPDTTALPADQAASEFQMLRQSYELLQDPERRRRYDEQRAHDRAAAPTTGSPPRVRSGDGWSGIGERRPLSGGEWFSLLLLLLALLISVVLGLGVASAQGRSWQVSPGWMSTGQTQGVMSSQSPDASPADGSDTSESALADGP